MLVEIPMVARCCFCAPLRYGLLVWAYIKLVTSVLAFGVTLMWAIIWLFFTLGEITLFILILSTLISLIADIVFNFVLIVGSHKKNKSLLCLYYRYAFAHAAIFVLLGVFWISYAIVEDGRPMNQPDSMLYVMVMVSSVIVPLFSHIYLFIVLRSEINKLKRKQQLDFVNPMNDYVPGSHEEVAVNKNKEKN